MTVFNNIVSPASLIVQGKSYAEYMHIQHVDGVETLPSTLTSFTVGDQLTAVYSVAITGEGLGVGVGSADAAIGYVKMPYDFGEILGELRVTISVPRPSWLKATDTPLARMLTGGAVCSVKAADQPITWSASSGAILSSCTSGQSLFSDSVYCGEVPTIQADVSISGMKASTSLRPLNAAYAAVIGVDGSLITQTLDRVASDGTLFRQSMSGVWTPQEYFPFYGGGKIDFSDGTPYLLQNSKVFNLRDGTSITIEVSEVIDFVSARQRGQTRFWILDASGVSVYDTQGEMIGQITGTFVSMVVGDEYAVLHTSNNVVTVKWDLTTVNSIMLSLIAKSYGGIDGICNGYYYYYNASGGTGGRLSILGNTMKEIYCGVEGGSTDGVTLAYPNGDQVTVVDLENNQTARQLSPDIGNVLSCKVTKRGLYVFGEEGIFWYTPMIYRVFAPEATSVKAVADTTSELKIGLEVL